MSGNWYAHVTGGGVFMGGGGVVCVCVCVCVCVATADLDMAECSHTAGSAQRPAPAV